MQQRPPIFKMGKDCQNTLSGDDHNVQQIPHGDGWHCCDAPSLHESTCVGNNLRVHMEGEGLAGSGVGGTRGTCDIKSAFCSTLDSAASPQAELSPLLPYLQGMSDKGGLTSSVTGSTRGPRALRLALRAFCAMSTTLRCRWMPRMPSLSCASPCSSHS